MDGEGFWDFRLMIIYLVPHILAEKSFPFVPLRHSARYISFRGLFEVVKRDAY